MNVLWEKRPTAKVFYERLNKWNDIDNNPKEAMRYTLKGKTKDFIRKLPVGEYTFREFSEYRYYLQDLLNQKNMKIKSLNVPEMEIVSVEQSPFNTSIKLNCRYDNNNKYSLIFFPSFLEINCISRLDFTLRVNVYNPGIAEKGYKYLTKKEFKMITVFFENIQETLIVGEESGIEFFSKYSEETDLNQRDG
jgi:hypothetical protein